MVVEQLRYRLNHDTESSIYTLETKQYKKMNPEQKQILQDEFKRTQNWSQHDIKKLARELGFSK